MSLCPECHVAYSPKGGGHCRGGEYGGCCKTFSSDRAADRHFVWEGEKVRCRTTEELVAKGYRETPRGWTNAPPMSDEVIATRAAQSAAQGVNRP